MVAALLAGAMAASKAKAAEIAVVAVRGSSTAAVIDNYGSALPFELDPSATEGLVRRALEAYRNDVAGQTGSSFSDAVAVVQT